MDPNVVPDDPSNLEAVPVSEESVIAAASLTEPTSSESGFEGTAEIRETPSSEASTVPTSPKRKPRKRKKAAPSPAQVLNRIGKTNDQAMAYVFNPDPSWQELNLGVIEELITNIPPVTAGALLGPDALCRHFLASAASGRYQDLFYLWELYKAFPDLCQPVVMSRTEAQERAKHNLRVATEYGLVGSAERVAQDIRKAKGLPWKWLQDILADLGDLIAQRPMVIAALWERDPGWPLELPEHPDTAWLAEAAQLQAKGEFVPDMIKALLASHLDGLPINPATLDIALATSPDQIPLLLTRIDMDAPDVVATLRWARDHGFDQHEFIVAFLEACAQENRALAAHHWAKLKAGQIAPADLPPTLLGTDLDGLDLGLPESWEIAKVLVDQGAALDVQALLDDIALNNRQIAEKAYEAAVCAGFDEVHLPAGLAANPNIKAEARCPKCAAWTWVRPRHEERCPRPAVMMTEGMPEGPSTP